MKNIIVTADIHICLKKDIPEEWQVNRYNLLFKTLIDACMKDKADLIIAGDLFEKNHPTLEEQEIAFKFLSDLSSNTIRTSLVGGNHETIAHNKNTFRYLKWVLPETVEVLDDNEVDIYKEYNTAIHYISHSHIPTDLEAFVDEMESYIDDCGIDRHILITHFRTTVGEYVKEELNTELLCKPFCLVIAGDIHAELRVDTHNLMYCNQPINSQFASSADTSYLNLTLGTDSAYHYYTKTRLPALIQWNRDAVDWSDVQADAEAHVASTGDFLKINLTGTLKELRNIPTNLPSIKINKVPLVEDTVVVDLPQSSFDNLSADMQLIEYLKVVPYTEENIQALLAIWKEVVS